MKSAYDLSGSPFDAASRESRDAMAGGSSVPSNETPTQAPLASWYTQGISDGLGDRLLMFDNTAAASLELLRLRPTLANAPGFERTLRETLQRLASFKHAAFAQARSLQRLDGDGALALISTHIEGKRLSEMFRRTDRHGGMHPAFATWLIRQLTTALADFHQHAEGIAHGALTPDRIILTPDRRLVITEHVLGRALDERRFSRTRLWRDLGIVPISADDEAPRLDARSDIVQLGVIALSVLLGRRVAPEEYPSQLGALLDEFSDVASTRSPALERPLREWLEHALDPSAGFETAMHAVDGLPLLAHPGEHLALDSGSSQDRFGNEQLQVSAPHALTAPEPQVTDMAFTSSVESVQSLAQSTAWADPPLARRFFIVRTAAIGLAVIALVEGFAISRLIARPEPTQTSVAPIDVPVTIDSPKAGARVLIDGREVGVTPLKINVGSAIHSIRVLASEAPPAPAAATVAAVAPSTVDPKTSAALASAAQRQRSGGVRLTSPVELQVLEGEKVLGSSADGPIVAAAGVHQLDFINTAIGFKSRQTVTIKAGEIIPLKVQPPDGRVSINAQPWAQVSIDGNAVGETPLANLSVAAGEHEVVFRHPQLGEKRETIVVKSGVQTRLSAALSK